VIALWGNLNDPPIAAVGSALARQGAAFTVLDQTATVVQRWSGASEAVLRTGEREVALDEISALYLRPSLDGERLRDPHGAAATLLAWADTTDALVVNRPAAMTPNLSKPLQARLIADAGFRIPETLVTTDAARVRAFVQRHGAVVYKSISGTRSIVRRLDPTRLVELDDIATCPTQFQRYIKGEELRVHVIGDGLHALSIVSGADDYRYPAGHEPPQATPIILDERVAERLSSMTRAMGLCLAGIDLRRTLEGELFCLEVNPSPGFTYYERLAGIDLATPIARLLLAVRASSTNGER
jgi:glutathione synthase/RimK-type ligase-like ATP-grasp enzyme